MDQQHDANFIDISLSKDESEIKYCEKCLGKYNVADDALKCHNCLAKRNCNFCGNCQSQMKVELTT